MSRIDVEGLKLVETPVKDIKGKLDSLKKGFNSHKTKDVKYRKSQLLKLKASFEKYAKEIHQSNYFDLGFSEYTSFFYCYNMVLSDIDHIIDNLENWAKPRSTDSSILVAIANSYIYPEPYGICLVFSAWNSQYQTLIQPLAIAIAAGNVVLAKPSEMAPFSAKLLEFILSDLDPEVVQIVQGGIDQCVELNKNKTDIIVFTGSPMKGKIVAKAAAEFLTPCILELGGQNPVIIDETVDLKSAAYNLISGRYVISGQACIAPEYLLVHKSIIDKLSKALQETVINFFGKDPKSSKDYCRIINTWHSERLAGLLQTHKGQVLIGGSETCDVKNKYIPPTIITFDSIKEMGNSTLSKDEIFGPILYMAPYESLNDAIFYINEREKPLSLYYFGFDKKTKEEIKTKTSSGAFVTNDTVVHFTSHYLPFGGVGNSGYGAYHGIHGFNALSHLKPVLEKNSMIVSFRYPPFTSTKQSLMKKILKNSNITQRQIVNSLFILFALILAFVLRQNFANGVHGFVYGL